MKNKATKKNVAETGKRNSSKCSLDQFPIEEHEKAILSPKPVLNLEPDSLTDAYLAACERGNQSRSQSVRSSLNSIPNLKSSKDSGKENSPNQNKSPASSKRSKWKSSWRYFCCVSAQHNIENEEYPSKKKPIKKTIVNSINQSFRRKNQKPDSAIPKKVNLIDPNNNDVPDSNGVLHFNDQIGDDSIQKGSSVHDKNIRSDTASDISDEVSSNEDYLIHSPASTNNLLGNVDPKFQNKKCLVLDLDETLVHSTFQQFGEIDFKIVVEIENRFHQVGVAKRPYLEEFLDAVGPLFECVMFTASLKKYADPVCDIIDPKGHLKHRLFRESCVFHQENYIKDLSRLGRDIDKVCIIDNSPASFLFQPHQAIHIITWYDDPNDMALKNLIPYLKKMAECDNVPEFIKHNQFPANSVVDIPFEWYINQKGQLSFQQETDDEDDLDETEDAYHNNRDLKSAKNSQVVANTAKSNYFSQQPKPSDSLPKFVHQAVKDHQSSVNQKN